MNGPINVWPNYVTMLVPDLRWLIEHQAEIVAAWPARAMHTPRPIKVWPDGRVRIEFVGTFTSFAEARAACSSRMAVSKEPT